MKTENKIIRLFIEEKKPLTIREISKGINSDYRITHTASVRLIEKGIILSKIVGKSTLCELNASYYGPETYRAENDRREHLLKDRNLRQMYIEVMGKIRSSMFIFLVFGSTVKGNRTRHSDIDLMFISNDKEFEEKVSNIISLLPLKTHTLVFTEDEFIRMKDAKDRNIIQEIIEKNIILYGIESYYRLKNA